MPSSILGVFLRPGDPWLPPIVKAFGGLHVCMGPMMGVGWSGAKLAFSLGGISKCLPLEVSSQKPFWFSSTGSSVSSPGGKVDSRTSLPASWERVGKRVGKRVRSRGRKHGCYSPFSTLHLILALLSACCSEVGVPLLNFSEIRSPVSFRVGAKWWASRGRSWGGGPGAPSVLSRIFSQCLVFNP